MGLVCARQSNKGNTIMGLVGSKQKSKLESDVGPKEGSKDQWTILKKGLTLIGPIGGKKNESTRSKNAHKY